MFKSRLLRRFPFAKNLIPRRTNTGMAFQHPLQCLQRLGKNESTGKKLLAAACGPKIYVFDAVTGNRLSSWPSAAEEQPQPTTSSIGITGKENEDGNEEPPEKRRKLSPTASANDQEMKDAAEVGTEEQSSTSWQSIPILVSSPKGEFVVAVTAEDKSIRVFSVDEGGSLNQLSVRTMPKRPCSLKLTADGSTILSGDKFGDVYSLPLEPKDEESTPGPEQRAHRSRRYRLEASELTVHSKNNLRIVEQHRKAEAKSPTSPRDSAPLFERQLLLGHVSVLTDLVFVSLPSAPGSDVYRSYVLTSDRDEHIRVSRGPPQCHVIENYCLGHTSFVNRLCVPEWDPTTLISGGGDDYILAWDWRRGVISQKLHFTGIESEVVVSNIWAVPFGNNADLKEKAKGSIIVTLEGIPKVFPFIFGLNGELSAQEPISLAGNALCVTSADSDGNIIVSVDNFHEPGSTKDKRSNPASPQVLLQAFNASSSGDALTWTEVDSTIVKTVNETGTFDLAISGEEKKGKQQTPVLRDLLYGAGIPRKRAGRDEE